MTEKTAPWWRSFTGKRRKAAKEAASILDQEYAAANQRAPASPTESEHRNPPTTKSQPKGADSVTDDTYDDSAVEPTFNEATNRRKLQVSRSGRYKEKRRMRVGLAQNDQPSSGGRGNMD